MILSYHWRATSISDCREQLGIGRDGVTAAIIEKTARANGLREKDYSKQRNEFKLVTLLAIVHMESNHFIVVERWSTESVDVVDPAAGRLQLTADEFDSGFTGVVLVFEPGVHFERSRSTAQPLWRRYLVKYILQAPGLLAQIIGASLLLQVLGLAL